MKNEYRVPKIGEVYLMRCDGEGSVQQGIRPVLIFQNNVGNTYSPNVIVIPLTSKIKKVGQPTHVFLPANKNGLARDSVALCENPECVPKTKLERYLTTISDEYMGKIAEAHLLATSAIVFIDPKAFLAIWEKAAKMNAAANTAS